ARDQNTLTLLDWGYANFRLAELIKRRAVLARPPVHDQPGLRAVVVAAHAFSDVIARGDRVSIRIKLSRQIAGPLSRGTVAGPADHCMIITVTLNAALDKTLEVPNFTPGRRHRTVAQTTMPGGKGVNIARAIKRLGQPVIAAGLVGGATGTRILEALSDESIL